MLNPQTTLNARRLKNNYLLKFTCDVIFYPLKLPRDSQFVASPEGKVNFSFSHINQHLIQSSSFLIKFLFPLFPSSP